MLRKVLLSLLGGFGQSLKLFCYTLLGALPLGLLAAFGSMSRFRPLRTAVRGLVWIVRGTPLMLQLIVIYYGPGLLSTRGNLWGGGSGGRMLAASVAFIINYAAYFAEIYRAGIESIPVGQYEAAAVLGYGGAQTFFKIILPQMFKRVIPPVTNEVITLVKDTSLASVIGIMEMFTRAKQIAVAPNSPGMLAFASAAVFYYVFNYAVAFLMACLERSQNYYR